MVRWLEESGERVHIESYSGFIAETQSHNWVRLVLNSGAWETSYFGEINNLKRNGLHDHTSTASHQYLLPCKHTCSATQMCNDCGKVHSFIQQPLVGNTWYKTCQKSDLIHVPGCFFHHCALHTWSSNARLPTTSHTPGLPSIILPLLTLVSFCACWNPFVLQSPVYFLYSLPSWSLSFPLTCTQNLLPSRHLPHLII